ncbi:unnamed protein product [Pleuronectes platessa]|uniref:Uncharacterized protein n=1 Tax=Pleuronectes platessa TaxID=8262 RepID=A0A9N7YM00_PLEPL|nr:unnamed protein product [Pleuronectes platessa]
MELQLPPANKKHEELGLTSDPVTAAAKDTGYVVDVVKGKEGCEERVCEAPAPRGPPYRRADLDLCSTSVCLIHYPPLSAGRAGLTTRLLFGAINQPVAGSHKSSASSLHREGIFHSPVAPASE